MIAGVALLSLWLAAPAAREDSVLRIGLLRTPGSALDSAMVNGITLGVEEAVRTGALFHWSVMLVMVASTHQVADMILVGSSPSDCDELAEPQKTVVVNIGCREPGLRNASKYPWVFHVEDRSEAYDRIGADATLWHSTLERYGAGQLNERFRRRFGVPMTAGAWAGWFAVKAVFESAMRAKARDPASLRAAITGAQFDGHKGVALRFLSGTNQLAQPFYVVRDGRATEAR
jgi:hypothetical protein